ncbi:MAG: peptidylprolyl isomerase [Proteobacteria bacterium]|nr:peptidylprolyl isomerase [Pseudomonadota bacterium]
MKHLSWFILLIASTAVLASCPDKQYYPEASFPELTLVTTSGNIVIELDRRKAPITVNSFLYYVEKKAFDNTLFHRVIKDYVVQAGAFNKDSTAIDGCGTIFNESGNGLKNEKGTIAMARYDKPHSAQSSFYFNMKDNSNLDPNPKNWGYTVFGYVLEGMDILEEISHIPTEFNAKLNASDVPVTHIYIKEIRLNNE